MDMYYEKEAKPKYTMWTGCRVVTFAAVLHFTIAQL